MSFEEALVYLRKGHRLYREAWDVSWSNLRDFIQFNPSYDSLITVFGSINFRPSDFNASDWKLWEPKKHKVEE